MNILNRIDNPKDLKELSLKEKDILSKEIRDYILDVISKNGGHLASNLGDVELTIALHSVYNTPKDKIVWDVGHQTYAHKILTGRKEEFKNIRKKDGLSGFPKTSESIYDCFNTGHSSTSISAALGMAKARDLKGEQHSVVAVIGDGALTGGMALEALNDCGYSKTNITVILNDNEMSISKNVGGISVSLGRIRSSKLHTGSKDLIKRVLEHIPFLGKCLIGLSGKLKRILKQILLPNMLFEDMGFTYLGPVDGHNIGQLESIMKMSKKLKGPVLIHVVTKKGKGYKYAEENPTRFHGIGPFDVETGKNTKEKKKDYSQAFGEKLVQLAEKDKKIVAICAAMKTGTGLTLFSERFPTRFFDVGIAEQHALTFAAGLAREGLKPVVSIYSSFYQRAYDQVIHDIATQNLPVVMIVDRAGVVGQDGETHQGVFDLSFFGLVPNLTIMAPKDFQELEDMLEYAVNRSGPTVIRFPRGGENRVFKKHTNIACGKPEILTTGDDITIVAIGKMVARAMEVAELLKKDNINAEVINTRFLKPIDSIIIENSIKKTHNVITIEDNILTSGLSSRIKELIIDKELKDVRFISFGYPEEFIKHGEVSEIEEEYGLDALSIYNKIKNKMEF